MNKGITRTEKRILAEALHNSDSGWELFFSKYDPMIGKITGWPRWHFTEEERLDVAQNIRVALQKSLPRFRQQSSLLWFIKQIAFRQCITEIRKQVRRNKVTIPLAQKSPNGNWDELEFADSATEDPHQQVVRKEETKSLYRAMTHLHETCKKSITMYYLHQMSYQEMSEQLGIKVNTVGSRLSKCLDKLHQQLRHDPAFKKEEA
jgi:RNA polymerase sigma-70 factor (ECF subfamily)